MSTRRNAAWNMANRVFSILLPLITAPYLARTVGRAGVGAYSYAWSISEIFVILGLLGLENYGVRAIAKVRDDREQLNRIFSEIYVMQLIAAGIVLIIWTIYAFVLSAEERYISVHLTWMSISCLVNLDWCLQGLDQFKPIAIRQMLTRLTAAVSIFLFVKKPEDIWIYGLAWALATVIGNLLCIPGLRGKVSLVKVPVSAAMKHFVPCAVLLISVLAIRVYRTMDKIMVGAIAGMVENGIYENAERIVYCLSGFISAIGTVMMPKISHLTARGSMKEVGRYMDLSMHVILCMTCGMAFGIAAVCHEFSVIYFGQDFAGSGSLMFYLGFTLILIGFANVIRTQWVLPQGKDHIFVRSVLAGAAINLIVNFILIPTEGAFGAVIGTLFAETMVPFVQFLHLRKELPYKRYIRIAAGYISAGLLMMLVIMALRKWLDLDGVSGLCFEVLFGIVVYGISCLILWHITDNPMKAKLQRMMRRK